MLYVPTATDEANAAKYYAGIARPKGLLERNALKLPIELSSRPLTNDDLNGIYNPSALVSFTTGEWSGPCDVISCFPFDMNGDVCKPTSREQTWKTVDGSVYSGCQSSCYGLFKYDVDDPKPSGLTLRGAVNADGTHSCAVRNVAKMMWFGIPATRGGSGGTVDGLTNVPPMVVRNDDEIEIPKAYCDWFGMSYEAGKCYRPWYQLVLEDYLIGKTMYRVFTVDRGNGGMPSNEYLQAIDSDEYHRVYQQIARAWAEHDPEFVPYRNTKYMFSKPPPTFSRPEPARVVRKAPDPDTPFSFDDVWESIGDNLILSLMRDVFIDIATDKLLDLAKLMVQKMAKILESLVQTGIEQLFAVGGKSLMTSAIRSTVGGLVLRLVGNFGVRGIQLLATAFASAIATFNIVQLTLGIAGLVLDLFDPLSLNSYLDDSTVNLYIDQFDKIYLDNFRTQQLTVRAVDILSMADALTEDDIFLEAIIAQSSYLSQLEYNSIGQRLDWSTDTDPGEPHVQQRSETINSVLYSTSTWDAETYNARQASFMQDQADVPTRLLAGASILAVAVGALTFAVVKDSQAALVLAFALTLVWIFFQIFVVARKTKLQTLMFRINMELLSRKE